MRTGKDSGMKQEEELHTKGGRRRERVISEIIKTGVLCTKQGNKDKTEENSGYSDSKRKEQLVSEEN